MSTQNENTEAETFGPLPPCTRMRCIARGTLTLTGPIGGECERTKSGIRCDEHNGWGGFLSSGETLPGGVTFAPTEWKDTNPKDAVGIRKVPRSTVSAPVIAEVGLGMMEGALKYGRHNYRVTGVRASVYYDAVGRHLDAWWEGQDIDPLSGIHHIGKAIAGLCVLRDAQMRGLQVDDRPPKSEDNWQDAMNAIAGALIDKYPDPVAACTEIDQKEKT